MIKNEIEARKCHASESEAGRKQVPSSVRSSYADHDLGTYTARRYYRELQHCSQKGKLFEMNDKHGPPATAESTNLAELIWRLAVV